MRERERIKSVYEQQLKDMESAGFVREVDAAKIVGRSPGGHLQDLFDKAGVSSVIVQASGKKPVRMYRREDLVKVRPAERKGESAKTSDRQKIDELCGHLSINLFHHLICFGVV